MKTCTKCGIEKNLEDFSKRNNRPCGYRADCKKCDNAAGKKRYHKNPEQSVIKHLKNKFGLCLQTKLNMINKQKNKCSICSNIFVKTPHVDHDHAVTDFIFIRGLLCTQCNSALGFSNDNIFILLRAIIYLTKYRLKLFIHKLYRRITC